MLVMFVVISFFYCNKIIILFAVLMAYGYATRRRKRRRSYVPRAVGRVRGRGSYMGELGRTILQGGGAALGGVLGGGPANPYGAVIGAGLGQTAGSAIADVFGLGAYNVMANSLIVPEGHQIPSFGDLGDAVLIKHREYIADVVVPATPGTFTNTTYVLNPGDPATFPWLSNIASSFDSYMFLGMIFEFKSMSSDVGSLTNIGLGSVIMATDYDAHDPPAQSKIEMENMQYACSSKPSETFCHIIECDPSVNVQPHLYVRTGVIGASEDARFYDHGNFQIATQGMPDNASGTLGELWVTYQIAFFKPQLFGSFSFATDFYDSATATTTSYWGSNATLVAGSSLGSSVTNNTLFLPGLLSNPAKIAKIGSCYWISYSCLGSSAALSTIIALIGTDCTVTIIDLQSAVTTTRQWFNCKVIVTGSSPKIDITAGTLPGTPTACNVLVTQIDSDPFPLIV